MDKKYQVFVSSTFRDLMEERQKVIQTLMEMDCMPAGMELFPAADEEQWEFIKKVIDDCDYYILIVGGRYGSVTADGISYTEKEYDYAVTTNKHVIAFVHANPNEIPAGKTELDQAARQKLAEFREKVCTGRLIKTWKNADELPGLVALSLNRAIKTHPAVGWVRGDSAGNVELLNQLNELRQRNEELEKTLSAIRPTTSINAAQLARGQEIVQLNGSYKLRGFSSKYKWMIDLTWDQVLAIIGPYLLQYVNEETVGHHLAEYAMLQTQKNYGKETWERLEINQTVLQEIKIQFMALGYIEVKSFQTVSKTMALFWILTNAGTQELLRVGSIKTAQTAE